MIRRPPRSTQSRSSAASDVYKRQVAVWVAFGLSVPVDGGVAGRLTFVAYTVVIYTLVVVVLTFAVAVPISLAWTCLLYTSDAADDLLCVDLGGRRIIKKK